MNEDKQELIFDTFKKGVTVGLYFWTAIGIIGLASSLWWFFTKKDLEAAIIGFVFGMITYKRLKLIYLGYKAKRAEVYTER